MEFNKIAGAVLLVLIVALVTSKIGDIVVPPHYAAHAKDDDHGGGTATTPTPKAPEPTFAAAINAATDAQGKRLANRCTSCHTFEKGGANKVGPNLWGVVGRKKGAVSGYNYSSAMKNAKADWTYEILYKYLKNPQEIVPGTKMAYRMPKADQRGAIIRYLRTMSDNPLPLPKAEPAADDKPDEKKSDAKKDSPTKTDDVKKDEPKKDDAAKDGDKKEN